MYWLCIGNPHVVTQHADGPRTNPVVVKGSSMNPDGSFINAYSRYLVSPEHTHLRVIELHIKPYCTGRIQGRCSVGCELGCWGRASIEKATFCFSRKTLSVCHMNAVIYSSGDLITYSVHLEPSPAALSERCTLTKWPPLTRLKKTAQKLEHGLNLWSLSYYPQA